ncbi:MAG: hypothetical protein V7638_4204 [Acidobacteriota bacterium]|jgi:hypothetical protein
MRQLAIAVLLACMLSATVRAGEVPSTGAAAPQPSSSAGVTGEIPTSGTPASCSDSTTILTMILTLISIVR